MTTSIVDYCIVIPPFPRREWGLGGLGSIGRKGYFNAPAGIPKISSIFGISSTATTRPSSANPSI